MKIYTRTGDMGTTSLVGGQRISKDSVRLEAYGTVDELNSFIGLLIAQPALTRAEDSTIKTLSMVQNKLFNIGAYLATDNTDNPMAEPAGLGHQAIATLEAQIDLMVSRLPEMRCFILPGGTVASAQAQVCRAVCRRAERRVVALAAEARVDDIVIRFLNRLSDYLFILDRHLNHIAGIPEIPWDKEA